MKCVIPEIAYHNRDPVLSIDFQLNGGDGVTRLATAGSDNHVVIWSASLSAEGEVSLECLCDLTRHQKAVNIVRWSPEGGLLASGDDESVIIVWHLKPGDPNGGSLFDDDHENKENWVVYKMIRSHLDDVYDLSWSGCGQFLLSGSVDNAAIITNVHKNTKVAHMSDSRGYVQGVSWNKKHNLVSTLSSDRVCRTYNNATKKLISKCYKSNLQLSNDSKKKKKEDVKTGEDTGQSAEGKATESSEAKEGAADNKGSKEKEVRLFHDETFKGFFRRLTWSPDGEILVAPSGVVETEESSKMSHCSWVFSRVDMSRPVLCLPTKDKYTTAVRFNPKLFKLRSVKGAPKEVSADQPWTGAKSLFALPYRLVYAVATQNAIMFYDTQQVMPFGRVSNVHYTGLTDLTWSPCGQILFASSSDGYCSIVTFAPGEIGEHYVPDCSPVDSVKDTTAPSNSTKESKSNAKRLEFITLSSPKANKSKKVTKVKEKKQQANMEMNLDVDLGVERMETDDHDDLKLVLEETEQEPPVPAAAPVIVDNKKRVPLTTIVAAPQPSNNKPSTSSSQAGAVGTPEKAKKRVNLITLSSPKTKP